MMGLRSFVVYVFLICGFHCFNSFTAVKTLFVFVDGVCNHACL